jgi:transglutaminase-like putative cysteine protease
MSAPLKHWRIPGRDPFRTRQLVDELARLYGGHPAMRDITAGILRLAGVGQRDDLGAARAIWAWVTRRVMFLNEAGEQIQTPARVLINRYGDCDDRTGLVCALLESIRIQWRTRLLATAEGVPFHIWPQARIGGRWVDLETSDDRGRFAEHPARLMERLRGLQL